MVFFCRGGGQFRWIIIIKYHAKLLVSFSLSFHQIDFDVAIKDFAEGKTRKINFWNDCFFFKFIFVVCNQNKINRTLSLYLVEVISFRMLFIWMANSTTALGRTKVGYTATYFYKKRNGGNDRQKRGIRKVTPNSIEKYI